MERFMMEPLIRHLLKLLFTLYPKLYRVVEINKPKDPKTTPYIYAHYHGDELVLVPAQKNIGVTTLSSESRDGRRMADVLTTLGYTVITGSSSHRSVGALIALKNHAKTHPGPISFAVDGPKGPRHEIKPGVIWLSQRLQFPIVFISVICPRRWTFKKSWNHCFIPKPFSQIQIYYSNPCISSPNEDPKQIAEKLSPHMLDWHNSPESLIIH